MGELLDYLNGEGIRTAVVSNFSFCAQTLKDRLDRLLPQNRFEFIIASSEYIFKKPHPRIFQLALTKARLAPGEAWHCGDSARCDAEGAVRHLSRVVHGCRRNAGGAAERGAP